MEYGISVYTLEDFSIEKNKQYIELAKKNGYNRVFTSMHMPEVNYIKKLEEINELFKFIKKMNMKLTVDISPISMKILGASSDNLEPIFNMGIDCIRLDYGFGYDEIALITNNKYGIQIELNASTITREEIEDLISKNVNMNNLRTCHNFYPKLYTGLSEKFFIDKTLLLKTYGLKVAAFIPSQNGKRGPIYEGLPTIEKHRYIDSGLAAKDLLYMGIIDEIYFGDAYATLDELKNVSSIVKDVVELRIILEEGISDIEKEIVFLGIHTNRPDASEYIIRSEESREYASMGKKIEPHNSIKRRKYCVTIDNSQFKRYSGELEICNTSLPKDNRVNVVGYVEEKDTMLVKYIKPGCKFRFV